MTVQTGTYDADDESLDTEVKDALDALAEGETSGLITTDETYYIVRIDSDTDEEATESNRESIIEERQDTLYDETLEAWQEDDGWTVNEKQLAKIEFTNYFTQETETEDTESTEETETESTEETDTEETDTESTEETDTDTESEEDTEETDTESDEETDAE